MEHSHAKRLELADGVILIGGNPDGVPNHIGTQVIERGIPFIPVPIFEGAGDVLWKKHAQSLAEKGISASDIETMGEEFDAELIVKSLQTLMSN